MDFCMNGQKQNFGKSGVGFSSLKNAVVTNNLRHEAPTIKYGYLLAKS